jgi:hypothetical protein
MFQIKVVQRIKTHFVFNNRPPPPHGKLCPVWDSVEKHGTARQVTDDNIIRRMRCACWITKARIYTHTHTQYLTLIAFPRQEWLRERASVLRYTYISCLVTNPHRYLHCILLQNISKQRVCFYKMLMGVAQGYSETSDKKLRNEENNS